MKRASSCSRVRPLLLTLNVLGAVYILTSLAWAVRHRPEPAPGGSLQCERPERFLGRLAQRTSVTETFQLRNVGREELHIQKVESSCGCTVGEPERQDLRPGESTGLRVTLSTRLMQGALRKRLSITCAPFSRLELTVSANVVPDFVADPAVINLGLLKVGDEARSSASLVPGPAPASFHYGLPLSSEPQVTASLHEGRLELVARPTRPGALTGSVTIPSLDPERAALRVPFIGESRP